MPHPSSCPPGLLALLAPWLALLAHLSLSSQAGDRRAVPVEKPPAVKGRTLILLDVNTKSPVRVTSENFLSLQLDPSIIHDGWLDFLSSRRLVTLARGLAPAFLRFAGKRTDFLQFQNLKNPAKSRGGPGPDYYLKNYEDDIVRSDIALDKQKGCKIAQHPDIMLELQREKAAQMHLVLLKEQFSNTYSNLTLTARSLDKLYNFADCSGLHLIFALNALRRNPDNSWNSSNALSLLKYSASKKYNISWELGNEPNNYRTLTGRTMNGSQLGKDYIQLKSLLQLIRTYARTSLSGPSIGRPRKNVIALLEGFMKVAGRTVDAVTWQHYYIDGRVAKVTDFLKTRLLDTLSDQIRKIQKVVNTYAPGKKIWLEGIGATSAGGTNNLSDSYAAGFLITGFRSCTSAWWGPGCWPSTWQGSSGSRAPAELFGTSSASMLTAAAPTATVMSEDPSPSTSSICIAPGRKSSLWGRCEISLFTSTCCSRMARMGFTPGPCSSTGSRWPWQMMGHFLS
ncbi:inactive heparanase-2 isoform X5 [Gopherus evgoodei]|uniref:inactive heparanase-2 isoform X5 n=1 Tax=Gopherus evgoodei TaxID=1825980 RepID=UPI0011CF1936|nr:inactive heparanase-2 isoform X5 [Gopherus evgoodei]